MSLTRFSANPFSIVDPDTLDSYPDQSSTSFECTCYPAGPEAPYCQHSTSGPCPSLVAGPYKASHLFERASLTDTNTDYMAPGFPTIPITPEARPFIEMPGSFSCVSDSNDAFTTNFYLDNIRIPSPLLYHKSKRESICGINKEDTSDFPDFELAHGQPKPEPDFVTYRNIAPDNVTIVAPKSSSIKDATLLVAKQPLLVCYSPQPGDTRANALDDTVERAEQSISGLNHSLQAANLGQIWRGLDEFGTLDMPGGFTWNASPEEIDERGRLSPTIDFECGLQSEDNNLPLPELTIPPNDQIMDIIPWSNNIVLPWNNNTASSPPPDLETKLVSMAPPSPCRDLVLATSYPPQLIVLSGRRQSCNSIPKLAPIDHHDQGERIVQLTQCLKTIIEPGQESRIQPTKESIVLADEALEKPAIRHGDPIALPQSCHGVLLQGSPCFETDGEDEGYFTSNQIGADIELLDHCESDADWSEWDWEIESSEEGNEGNATRE
jgi:hypothetical protein